MPSSKQKNHLQLVKSIAMYGLTPPSACDRCSLSQTTCIIMAGSPKCSECTCRGQPCVPVSLESLNRAHNWLKSKLDVVLNECAVQGKILEKQAAHLSTLNAKVLCLFKTLKLNELRAFTKVRCVAEELGDDMDGIMDDKNLSEVPNLDSLLDSLSPSLFMDPEPPSQIAEASLRNWVSYLEVSTCFLRYHILSIWWGSGLPH